MSRKKEQNVLHCKSKTPTKENKLCVLFHLLRQLELYQSNLIHNITNYKAFMKHLRRGLYSSTVSCNQILYALVITLLVYYVVSFINFIRYVEGNIHN